MEDTWRCACSQCSVRLVLHVNAEPRGSAPMTVGTGEVQALSLVGGDPYPGPHPLSGPQFLICQLESGPPYRAAGCINDKSSKHQSSEHVST